MRLWCSEFLIYFDHQINFNIKKIKTQKTCFIVKIFRSTIIVKFEPKLLNKNYPKQQLGSTLPQSQNYHNQLICIFSDFLSNDLLFLKKKTERKTREICTNELLYMQITKQFISFLIFSHNKLSLVVFSYFLLLFVL